MTIPWRNLFLQRSMRKSLGDPRFQLTGSGALEEREGKDCLKRKVLVL